MFPRVSNPQILLIDADDTLWENLIYFEQALADFLSFLDHPEMTGEQVRAVLNEVELETIRNHGYGCLSFARSLAATLERLSSRPVTPAMHDTVRGFAHRIFEKPVQLMEDVPETLLYLRERSHRLILMTKGDLAEQSNKIEGSGLKDHFEAVEIVAEKTPDAYQTVLAKHKLAPDITWMIGNSLKSDINPALATGINAVFVPHRQTWIHEHEEAGPTPHGVYLLEVERFADLQKHF